LDTSDIFAFNKDISSSFFQIYNCFKKDKAKLNAVIIIGDKFQKKNHLEMPKIQQVYFINIFQYL